MKKTIRWFGIIAISAVIGLSLVSCQALGSAIVTAENANAAFTHQWPETLQLSGKAVVGSAYDAYKGNEIAFSDGEGKIDKDGSFTFTREIPDTLEGFNVISNIFEPWEDAAPSNDARYYMLACLPTDGSYKLYRESKTTNATGRTVENMVSFIYTDKDVTITGKESSATETVEREGQKITETKEMNLSLKAGWNAVAIQKDTVIGRDRTAIYTYSVTNYNGPTLKWVLR
jgi:hypothetical protein